VAAAGVEGGLPALRAEFRRLNALDYALYEAACGRFEQQLLIMNEDSKSGGASSRSTQKLDVSPKSDSLGGVTVVGDRYDYLLKFARRHSIAAPFTPDDGRELGGVEDAVAAADAAAAVAVTAGRHHARGPLCSSLLQIVVPLSDCCMPALHSSQAKQTSCVNPRSSAIVCARMGTRRKTNNYSGGLPWP
jgi:hypothetical protein